MTNHPYTHEELLILHEDGTLDPRELSDDELEMALSMGLIPYAREHCNRLLR